ncbi:MAG: sugar phosphate isomerase/epimerase [Oscillospiraceae bacterium]|nr:sugar phosphate isomerase/epimerase [Oscillospiraceae bacterium]
MEYKLGLVSVSFRNHTPREILSAMKECGLKYIEWGSDVHVPLHKASEIAALQKEYGIECSSYGTYFRFGVTPISELEEYISAAKTLGTDILRLWCGDKNSEDYSEDEKSALFSLCSDAAKIAENHGVTLCMECHNYTYTNTKESAAELMEAVASENFKMYWQPNQYRDKSENIAYARLLAKKTVHLHVFNWERDDKFPLMGAKDIWKEYLSCFTGERTLLLEFMPDDRLDSLKTEAEALKEIVK